MNFEFKGTVEKVLPPCVRHKRCHGQGVEKA